jgi:hypothetical protein
METHPIKRPPQYMAIYTASLLQFYANRYTIAATRPELAYTVAGRNVSVVRP